MSGLTALKKLREDKGWTQETLAHKLRVSPITVSRWETGARYPRKRECESLSKVTGIPFHKILADSVAAEGKQ